MFVITKSEWKESLIEELNSLCSKISEPFELTGSDYVDKLEAYVCGISGCERWNNVPMASQGNINTGFEYHGNFGRRIAFIDTGVLFKKGKSGVMFSENGIAIKPVMGKGEMFTDYFALCTSAVVNNGTFLVAENKFNVTSFKGLPVIDATDVMLERLSEIRRILILNSADHNNLFNQALTGYSKIIADEANKNNEFLGAAEYFYKFTDGTTPEIQSLSAAIYAIALTIDAQFEKAAKIANKSDVQGVKDLIGEKSNDYTLVECGELYLTAKEKYEKKDYGSALKAARDSVYRFPAVENWQLYFDILYDSANESNKFNHTVLESFKSHSVDPSDAKSEVINKEQERIAELAQKYEKYLQSMGDIVLDKVLAEDLDFFKSNPEMCKNVDKYGMNAVMYAVLFSKYDVYSYLTQKYGVCKQRNVFGHTIVDIASMKLAFESCLIHLRLSHDEEFRKECESNRNFLGIIVYPGEEEKRSFRYLSKYFCNYTGDFDPLASDYADFYFSQNVNEDDEFTNSDIAKRFFAELVEDYAKRRNRVTDDILKYLNKEPLEKGEEPDIPLISECENTPEFRKIFSDHRESSISGYIKIKLGEKGEFEKTADYEQRKQRISEEAERDFENNFERHKETCYSIYVSRLKKDSENVERTNLRIGLASIFLRATLWEKISLGSYDADNETFKLHMKNDIESEIKIPIEIASDFKALYEKECVKYRVDGFEILPDEIIEFSCSAYYKNELYPFLIRA